MQLFTPFEYLLIDIANHKGLDKELFDDRIEWVKSNIHNLEAFVKDAADPAQYVKAVLALRQAQAGKPIGHMISLDAVCSGIQVMSALTGCIKGCEATGLINPNKRSDCYTEVTTVINQMLEADGHLAMKVPRADAKQAVMTAGYGSEAKPKEIFGDFVGYFHQATMAVAPGAFKLMPVLVKTWNKNALDHSWVMPDGFNVFIPVIRKETVRLRIDELQGASVYFEYSENAPLDYAKANCANVIHSVDALVLRNMIRRCSYNVSRVEQVSDLLTMRILSQAKAPNEFKDTKLEKLVELAQKNAWIDPIFIDFITEENVHLIPIDIAQKLNDLITKMLEHEPFDLITVHDAFRCHPKYGNTVRYWYKEIMAELSESNVLASIYSQLTGKEHKFNKYGNIADLIRQSNYGLS